MKLLDVRQAASSRQALRPPSDEDIERLKYGDVVEIIAQTDVEGDRAKRSLVVSLGTRVWARVCALKPLTVTLAQSVGRLPEGHALLIAPSHIARILPRKLPG